MTAVHVLRAAERFESVQPGIRSRHCFSAGAHYDPARLGVGPLVGVDEHVLDPGAGFAVHAHRGVDIVSRVVSGALRHEDDEGRVRVVRPGELQVQVTGSGVRHAESNASDERPLVLVQTVLLGGAGPSGYECTTGDSVAAGGGTFAVHRTDVSVTAALVHAYVAGGTWTAGEVALAPGDSVSASDRLDVAGSGELLVWHASP